MGRTALSVAESYRAAGYKSAGHGRIPDDHIATELLFMTSLCRDKGTGVTQLSFLENHLSIWMIDDFADRVRRADASGAYATAAMVAADLVRCDKKLIAELIASPPSPQKGDLR